MMRASRKWFLVAVIALTLLVWMLLRSNDSNRLIAAIRGTNELVLYEGLPHQGNERLLFEAEQRDKTIQELNGYPFYQDLLPLTGDESQQLSEVFTNAATYQPFGGEKKCGGFHPDFAVEWQVRGKQYRVLICFGCHEVKVFGPGIDSRFDLANEAFDRLQLILKAHRKNRPSNTKDSI